MDAEGHVFISYASRTEPGSGSSAAAEVCAGLEARGIRCWMAPRDVRAGRRYASEIQRAIAGSRCMIVVVSPHAMASEHMLNEIELAVNSRVEIIPLKIDATSVSGEMAYYLQRRQWLDATQIPLTECIAEIARAVCEPGPTPAAPQARPGQTLLRASWGRLRQAMRRHPVLAGCAVGVLLLIALPYAYVGFLRLVIPDYGQWLPPDSKEPAESDDGGDEGSGFFGRPAEDLLGPYQNLVATLVVKSLPSEAEILLIGGGSTSKRTTSARGHTPFRPFSPLGVLQPGSYTALVYKPGYEVERRDLVLSAGEKYEEFFELRPAPARSEPLEIDIYEFAERQMQLLEQEVLVRGRLKLAREYGEGWESVASDYYAFKLEAPPVFRSDQRLRSPVLHAYADKGERGTDLYRRLRRADAPGVFGEFVLRIPLGHFTPRRGDRSGPPEVHAELVRWALDQN